MKRKQGVMKHIYTKIPWDYWCKIRRLQEKGVVKNQEEAITRGLTMFFATVDWKEEE